MANEYNSPIACIYHYLHMAQGNYNDYLKTKEVWIKKYFYVLRPLFAIKWIEQGSGIAPTPFKVLLEKMVTNSALSDAINKLIELKLQGNELAKGARIPVISEYIEAELVRLESGVVAPSNSVPAYLLDQLFRYAILKRT